ncbi:hypothetical protein RIF29_43303 [Crotalaria pallida]|uniref:Uncharacterized protein n=1 Tax=Crotalaria pallida TaxID=3830 RepID=A0AAN9E3B2_CROPI
MNGAKRSAEAVGCKNGSVGERSALEGRTRASSGGRSGSENVGLSNANVGENPMPRKPKGSSARFVHGGCPCFFRVRRGRENASSQCSSTRRYGAEVTHAILPGKARTTFNKRVPVPETDTGEPATEAPVNGGRNYNGPKASQKVWHLDVGSSPPGAVVGSKGWAVRPLKRASGSTAETAMGSLPLRGWSERSFENSREGHGETSRFSLTIANMLFLSHAFLCLSSFMVRYSGVLGVEEPHQSISNLVVKLYCGDDTVGEVLRKNSSAPG